MARVVGYADVLAPEGMATRERDHRSSTGTPMRTILKHIDSRGVFWMNLAPKYRDHLTALAAQIDDAELAKVASNKDFPIDVTHLLKQNLDPETRINVGFNIEYSEQELMVLNKGSR